MPLRNPPAAHGVWAQMRQVAAFVTALVALACARSAAPPHPVTAKPELTPFAAPPPGLRLPPTARPLRYALHLSLDPSKERFEGEVRIALRVTAPTDVLWLNGTGLEVVRAELEPAAGASRPLKPSVVGDDWISFRDGARVEPGDATLVVAYRGTIDRERSRGLYAVSEGTSWYAYTFFEPIDARRAFPCFDEPAAKVPWQLTLRVPPGSKAFANTPEQRQATDESGWSVHTFAPTPPLPSYLVAFGVGPFDVLEAAPAGQARVPVRVILPQGRAAEARYTVEATPRIVDALEKFIGLPYPYAKLDVLVVPRDWGTMEHPGLVAMGQPLALIRPEEVTEARKQAYANIGIHELAHFWYGDLVTTEWWNDVWLNEALATWVDIQVTELFEPSWKWRVGMQSGSRAMALHTDGLQSAQPVQAPIETKEDIGGSFENATTYAKGAAVLFMIEGWLGEEKLRGILRDYLKANAWMSARAENLLAAVEAGAGVKARGVLEDFITQAGAPIVTAALRCEPGRAPALALTQERYLESGTPAAPQHWRTPVCVRTDAGSERCTLLEGATGELPLEGAKCPAWVLANAGGRGYYRVRYSPADATKLLLGAPLSVAERVAVASDVASLASRGDLPADAALSLVPHLAKDPHPTIFFAALQLGSIAREDLLSEAGRGRLASFARNAFSARARQVGWEPAASETPQQQALRMRLLQLLGSVGEDRAVRAEAHRRILRWLKDRQGVHPSLLGTVASLGARQGDAALFDRLLDSAKQTPDRAQKGQLISALAGFREPALVDRALRLLLSDEVDLRDADGVLYGTLFARETRDTAWRFLEEHFDALASRMRDDELTWLAASVGNVCDDERLQRAERLFREKGAKYGLSDRALSRAVEQAQNCIARAKVTVPAVEAFLKAKH